MTGYVVLERREAGETLGRAIGEDFLYAWVEVARVSAHSAVAAIREHGQAGTFVAVPVRNWKVLDAEEAVQTRIAIRTPAEA